MPGGPSSVAAASAALSWGLAHGGPSGRGRAEPACRPRHRAHVPPFTCWSLAWGLDAARTQPSCPQPWSPALCSEPACRGHLVRPEWAASCRTVLPPWVGPGACHCSPPHKSCPPQSHLCVGSPRIDPY